MQSKSEQVIETATVVAVEGQQALVECVSRSACSSCSKNQQCGNGAIAKAFPQRRHQFTVTMSEPVQAGDKVELALAAKQLVHGALLVYLFPLLMLLVGAGFGQLLAQRYFLAEYCVLGAAIISFAGSFLLVQFLAKRYLHQNQLQPQMRGLSKASQAQ